MGQYGERVGNVCMDEKGEGNGGASGRAHA